MSEEIAALQEEEVEVLKSIYEGDDQFTALSDVQYQYKYGEDGKSRSFILDITWGKEYPNEAPSISLDTFYNSHVKDEVKSSLKSAISDEAEQYLGMSMTYSLFEFVKENFEDLIKKQPENLEEIVSDRVKNIDINEEDEDSNNKPKEKKEQLTKQQKRRMWKKGGLDKDDRPRGWDWVDVIRHLSQTGGKPE